MLFWICKGYSSAHLAGNPVDYEQNLDFDESKEKRTGGIIDGDRNI